MYQYLISLIRTVARANIFDLIQRLSPATEDEDGTIPVKRGCLHYYTYGFQFDENNYFAIKANEPFSIG